MEKRRPGRPPVADKCSRLTINLPAAILENLKEQAEREDKSTSALVVEFIKKGKTMETEFEIDLETFLLGGTVGVSPYRQKNVEGFHCLTGGRPDAIENLANFNSYKQAIRNILSMYGWDSEEGMCVDLPAEGIVQKFEMPSDEWINAIFEKEKTISIQGE